MNLIKKMTENSGTDRPFMELAALPSVAMDSCHSFSKSVQPEHNNALKDDDIRKLVLYQKKIKRVETILDSEAKFENEK